MAPAFVQITVTLIAFLFVSTAYAEQHTVRFENKCGRGTPTLIKGAQTLYTGSGDYVSNGVLSSALAYLQTGECGFNGENCAIVEFTLGNPQCVGCGSSTDISLIAPHALNVETSFSYFNGCDGTGATCATKDCSTAFFKSDDNQVQVACQADNVNLLITFCGSAEYTTARSQPTTTKAQSLVAAPSPPITHDQGAPSVTPVHSTPIKSTPSSIVNVGRPPSSQAFSVVATPMASASSTPPTCRRARQRRDEEPFIDKPKTIPNGRRRHHARLVSVHGSTV